MEGVDQIRCMKQSELEALAREYKSGSNQSVILQDKGLST